MVTNGANAVSWQLLKLTWKNFQRQSVLQSSTIKLSIP